MSIHISLRLSLLAILASLFVTGQPDFAQAQKVGASGLPLPRFVSLKSNRVNMRVGPGRDYKVQWLYVRKGLPMEIIREFGNWRKVRDPHGNEGWVLHSLLSGKRVSIITPWDAPSDDKKMTAPLPTVKLRKSATENSGVVAKVEAGTLGTVEACDKQWCKLNLKSANHGKLSGWVEQSLLWGVYPDEKIEN